MLWSLRLLMKNKLVSIIIPAYNSEKYILETLESIASQSYSNWEIIVVDDCSSDRTEEEVKNFSKSFISCDIRYVKSEQNQGVSATRNSAILLATGEYIAFLDSDDIWSEHHLLLGIQTLEKQDADILYSPVQTFDAISHRELVCERHSEENLEKFPISLFIHDVPIYPSTIIARKSIFAQVGLFDTSLRTSEDIDFFIRVAAAGYKFFYLDEVTTLLRRGHASLSANKARIKEDVARTIRKHINTNIGSKLERHHIASMWYLAAAKHNLEDAPLKSAKFLFWAWLFRLEKVKYLAGILVALYYSVKKLKLT